MKMKKIILTIFVLMTSVYAQEAGILLQHYGFGETQNEAKFTIHCSGDVPIAKIFVYVDGEEIKTMSGANGGYIIGPKMGVSFALTLEPGNHLIEAKTPEGAYDSLELTISDYLQENNHTPKEEQELPFPKTIPLKVVVVFLAISVIAFFLLAKKSKLK